MSGPTASKSEQQQREGSVESHSIEVSPQATLSDPYVAILSLQQSVGNQAVGALVQNRVPSMVHSVINGIGQPIDPNVRTLMESRFGHDFSNVRIHTGARAAASAEAVSAKAYTIGSNVVFGEARYAPDTSEGKRLLAHELAHVIQQGRGGPAPALDPASALEQAADSAATGVVHTEGSIQVSGASGPGLACDRLDDLRKNPIGTALKVLSPVATVLSSPPSREALAKAEEKVSELKKDVETKAAEIKTNVEAKVEGAKQTVATTANQATQAVNDKKQQVVNSIKQKTTQASVALSEQKKKLEAEAKGVAASKGAEALGFVKGVILEGATLLDICIWLGREGRDLSEWGIKKTLAGLPNDQRKKIPYTDAQIIAFYKQYLSGESGLAKARELGLIKKDETGEDSLATAFSQGYDSWAMDLQTQMGVDPNATEMGIFTHYEAGELSGSITTQVGLAYVGVEEVQLGLKIVGALGATKGIVTSVEKNKNWASSMEFWTSVLNLLLSVVGLSKATASKKIISAVLKLGAFGNLITPISNLVSDYQNPALENDPAERHKKLSADWMVLIKAFKDIVLMLAHSGKGPGIAKPEGGTPTEPPTTAAPPKPAAPPQVLAPDTPAAPKLPATVTEPSGGPPVAKPGSTSPVTVVVQQPATPPPTVAAPATTPPAAAPVTTPPTPAAAPVTTPTGAAPVTAPQKPTTLVTKPPAATATTTAASSATTPAAPSATAPTTTTPVAPSATAPTTTTPASTTPAAKPPAAKTVTPSTNLPKAPQPVTPPAPSSRVQLQPPAAGATPAPGPPTSTTPLPANVRRLPIGKQPSKPTPKLKAGAQETAADITRGKTAQAPPPDQTTAPSKAATTPPPANVTRLPVGKQPSKPTPKLRAGAKERATDIRTGLPESVTPSDSETQVQPKPKPIVLATGTGGFVVLEEGPTGARPVDQPTAVKEGGGPGDVTPSQKEAVTAPVPGGREPSTSAGGGGTERQAPTMPPAENATPTTPAEPHAGTKSADSTKSTKPTKPADSPTPATPAEVEGAIKPPESKGATKPQGMTPTFEERLSDLKQRRADNVANMEGIKKQLGSKSGEVGNLAGKHRKETNPTKKAQLKQQLDRANAEKKALQDKFAQLATENVALQVKILEKPPVDRRQMGMVWEKENVGQTGLQKNTEKFKTSFTDSSSPDGKRIPDHVVQFDKDGNWVKVNTLGEAEFIADSKLLGKSVTATPQIKGFIELASKTRQKVLVLLTDPGASIHPGVHKFAANPKYGVRVILMTRPSEYQ